MADKIKFHVPFMGSDGEIEYGVSYNNLKRKVNKDGQLEAEINFDENGYAIMEPIMLDDLIVNVLEDFYEGDQLLTGTEKIKRHVLAMKVRAAGEDGDDYTRDELDMIETLAAKNRRTLALGRINEAINGK